MTNYISPFTPELPAHAGEKKYWGRLYGSAKSLAIYSAAKSINAPFVVLTSDVKSMENMFDEICFFQDSDEKLPILTFPDWETLPYDLFSPYQDIISDRLQTLKHLDTFNKGLLLVSITTAMHRLMPVNYLISRSLKMQTGEKLIIGEFRNRVLENGYRVVSQVMQHGDLTIRGSILDIFPMGARQPFRIDLFDDEIDSIRIFDPETQRSLKQTNSINILPANEISLTDECINRFRANWRNRFQGNPSVSPIYNDVSNNIAPAGIEYYLSLFYESTAQLFDFLPNNFNVIFDDGAIDAAESFWCDIQNRFNNAKIDSHRSVLPPEEVFVSPARLYECLKTTPKIQISGLAVRNKVGASNFSTRSPVYAPIDIRASQPLGILKRFLDKFKGKVLLVAESPGRRETILDIFRANNLYPQLYQSWSEFRNAEGMLGLTVSPLEQGAFIDDPALVVFTETQLFGERVQQRRLRKRKKNDTDSIVRNLTELTINSPVVHEENGVGRYKGLITLKVDGVLNEYFKY